MATVISRPRLALYKADASNPFVMAAMALMLLSSALRLWYYVVNPLSGAALWVHLVLPLAAAMIFIGAIAFFGVRTATPTAAGVLLGVVFFLLKAWADFTPLHRTLCTILYLIVAVLYSLTLLGIIPTKKLLYPLFGLPFLYHVFVEDTQYYFFADPPVPVFDWLPEMSVLCIMAGLFCLSLGLEKKAKTPIE